MAVMKRIAVVIFSAVTTLTLPIAAQHDAQQHAGPVSDEGLGRVHMDISCSAAVAADFDRALALLHNFWYARAFERFNQVAAREPGCAMAYWGAAMTYNHPFWDPPSQADETAAWALVQKGLGAHEASPREKLYLAAVTALFYKAGAGSKQVRDRQYRDAMAAAYAKFPDDETKLFYGLSILGAVQEGGTGFEPQAQAAALFEEVHRHQPDHPGVLHYLIHAYDDPNHAQQGLDAARAYAKTAAAVPHALHMPSHIFTRLGYWDESAATNLKGWDISEADVKRAGESGAYRDFHNLEYLEYAYIELGRFRDAQHTVDIVTTQFNALRDKTTAADSPELQSRHVRGRTIYAVPDRVIYAYFDMLTRLLVESGQWDNIDSIPLVIQSRDFVGAKLQWQAKAAAVRKDANAAKAAAAQLAALARESGQHPFAQLIIGLQAIEADAFAAEAAGDSAAAVAKLKEAVAKEDSIDDLSQPPYPVIPANELLGEFLLTLNRPADATVCFENALRRTPNRPMAVFGLARAAQALGENEAARKRYVQFLGIWRAADPDRRELAAANAFLRGPSVRRVIVQYPLERERGPGTPRPH